MVEWLKHSPSKSEVAGLDLTPGTLCWKVGSYLWVPGRLQ